MQAAEDDMAHILRDRLNEIDWMRDIQTVSLDVSDLVNDWWRECERSHLRPGAILFSMQDQRDALLQAMDGVVPRSSNEYSYTRAFKSIVDKRQSEIDSLMKACFYCGTAENTQACAGKEGKCR